MRLRDCAFFADQNVNADVVVWMRRSGVDIMSAADESMSGALDDEILARATALGRVVSLTTPTLESSLSWKAFRS